MASVMQSENAALRQGLVQAFRNGTFLVACDREVVEARKAECCLHELAPGDLVLCHAPREGQVYILGLLQRAEQDRPARLCLERGVSLTAARGEVVLSADKVRLNGRKALDLSGSAVTLSSERQTVRTAALSLTAGLIEANIGALRCACGAAEWTADRIIQRVKRLYRDVADFEESRIGRLRQMIGRTFSLHAKQAEIVAEERVKIDGEKIHLG